MKMYSKIKIILLSLCVLLLSCEVETSGPGPDLNDLKAGTTTLGGDGVYNSTVNINGGTLIVTDNAMVNKVNLNSGVLTLSGNASVATDVNVKNGTVFNMGDNTVVNKVNMSGGTAYLFGNATVNTDLNYNSGVMYIGKDFASTGVVTFKGNFNVSTTVKVEYGTLRVEGDLNGIGNVVLSEGATLEVLGNSNP